jgi:hypothetical protein
MQQILVAYKGQQVTGARVDQQRQLQTLNIRLQFPKAHSFLPNCLTSSIAPENPHPYAGDTFLLAAHFHPVVSENIVLSRSGLHDSKRRVQRIPTGCGQMDTLDVMVSATQN